MVLKICAAFLESEEGLVAEEGACSGWDVEEEMAGGTADGEVVGAVEA